MKRGTAKENKEHLKTIKFLMVANFPIIYITSWEEDRVGAAIGELSADLKKQVISWSCTEGLIKDGKKIASSTADPLMALDYILQEREAIWRVQFRRHKQAIPEEGIDELVRLSKGFSGAEIEQALVDAMFLAFSDNRRSCQMSDLTDAIRGIKPLSESRRDELTKMAEIAERSATQASSYIPEEVTRAEVGLARELKHVKRRPGR